MEIYRISPNINDVQTPITFKWENSRTLDIIYNKDGFIFVVLQNGIEQLSFNTIWLTFYETKVSGKQKHFKNRFHAVCSLVLQCTPVAVYLFYLYT